MKEGYTYIPNRIKGNQISKSSPNNWTFRQGYIFESPPTFFWNLGGKCVESCLSWRSKNGSCLCLFEILEYYQKGNIGEGRHLPEMKKKLKITRWAMCSDFHRWVYKNTSWYIIGNLRIFPKKEILGMKGTCPEN